MGTERRSGEDRLSRICISFISFKVSEGSDGHVSGHMTQRQRGNHSMTSGWRGMGLAYFLGWRYPKAGGGSISMCHCVAMQTWVSGALG